MTTEVRGTEQFKDAGGDSVQMKEGVTLEPIMLSRLHAVESVETKAMNALHDQIQGNGVLSGQSSYESNDSQDEGDDEKELIDEFLNSDGEIDYKEDLIAAKLEMENEESNSGDVEPKLNGGIEKYLMIIRSIQNCYPSVSQHCSFLVYLRRELEVPGLSPE